MLQAVNKVATDETWTSGDKHFFHAVAKVIDNFLIGSNYTADAVSSKTVISGRIPTLPKYPKKPRPRFT